MPSQQFQNETGDDERERPKKPGHLGTYGVDCKEVRLIICRCSVLAKFKFYQVFVSFVSIVILELDNDR